MKNNLLIKILIIPFRCIRKTIYIFNRVKSKFYKFPKRTTVVVCMDGGLSSQMFDYVLGEVFKRNGYIVKYDLMFFKNDARDAFGKDARFFEIKKLFPELKIQKASTVCIEKYKEKCRTTESDITKIIEAKKNVYLVNDHPLYYPSKEFDQIRSEIFTNFYPPVDKTNRKKAEEIIKDNFSCAVHVRRGDLSDAEIAKRSGYGDCVTDAYYIKAISLMKKLIPNVKFYFFSDDLMYVQNTLIKMLPDINYQIVDVNSATVKNGGGYKDFYLIYLCKNQICSLGSFGRQAAFLNKYEKKIIISPSNVGENINQIILDKNGNIITSNISNLEV